MHLKPAVSSITDFQLPKHLNRSGMLDKISSLPSPGDFQVHARAHAPMSTKVQLPSQSKNSSTSTVQSPKNHTSPTNVIQRSKLQSKKLLKLEPLGDYSHLRAAHRNQTSQWLRKNSFEGLVCESGPLCPGTGCISQLSYLWNMTHLYAAFHAKGIELLRSGQSQSVKTLTWYCDTLGSCDGMGYQFQGLTTTWILGMLTGRVVLFRWHQKSTVSDYLSPNMIDWRFMNYKLKGSSVNVGDFVKYRGKNIAKYHQILMEALTSKATHVQMHFNSLHDLNNLVFSSDEIPSKEIPGIVLPPSGQFIFSLTESVGIVSMFNFNDRLKLFVTDLQSQITKLTHGHRYVALHLRTGKFEDLSELGTQNRAAHMVDWIIAIECAIKQANKHIGPSSVIILVSDSVSAKHWVAQKYSRIKIFESKIVHVDRSSDVDEEGMLGVWQDIIIMAQSYVLVKHISTFSDVPALMCAIPYNRVVDYGRHC